jgi:hypothetical protein
MESSHQARGRLGAGFRRTRQWRSGPWRRRVAPACSDSGGVTTGRRGIGGLSRFEYANTRSADLLATMLVPLMLGGCPTHGAAFLGELLKAPSSLRDERQALEVGCVLRLEQREAGLQLASMLARRPRAPQITQHLTPVLLDRLRCSLCPLKLAGCGLSALRPLLGASFGLLGAALHVQTVQLGADPCRKLLEDFGTPGTMPARDLGLVEGDDTGVVGARQQQPEHAPLDEAILVLTAEDRRTSADRGLLVDDEQSRHLTERQRPNLAIGVRAHDTARYVDSVAGRFRSRR